MTILMFSRLFLPHLGGVEMHVLEIGDRLAKMGHKIVLITEELSDASLKDYQSSEISANIKGKMAFFETYHIPVGRSERLKKFKIWFWLWKNRNLIVNSDIIHCHDVFFWFLPFKTLYPKKPVFTTFHGYETKFPPSKRAITIRHISEWLSWGNICVGSFISKWYGTRPDAVMYGGVVTPKKESKSTKRGKIVFIGRFEHDTGILAYDTAAGILNKKSDQYDFFVRGNGSLAAKLKHARIVKSNEQNMYSFISDAEIVFASSYLSILQAFMMKKPVISFYDNPLKEDYLKMTPFAKWIFIENSAEAIVERVLEIRKNPTIAVKNVEFSREWVKRQTWDEVVKTYLSLWRKKSGLNF